jgi:hypothetical protein
MSYALSGSNRNKPTNQLILLPSSGEEDTKEYLLFWAHRYSYSQTKKSLKLDNSL